MSRPVLEIAANSIASALAAQQGGADRVELCANLDEGGTTPSYGTIAVARDQLRIPLYVLIRPRAGDFCYDAGEIDVMMRDVECCVRLGCDGIVIGALDIHGEVDETVCRDLINAAGRLGVTFHRAFDVARDQSEALEAIIRLGCERVLTSGGAATALEGAERVAEFVSQAGSRIQVMAGAGLSPANVATVWRLTNAHEFHCSARAIRISMSRHRNRGLTGLNADWSQTDVVTVRAMVNSLEAPATEAKL